MQSLPSLPPKPVADILRPELTRLPEYTWRRRALRYVLLMIGRIVVKMRVRLTTRGLENFPKHGPGLIVLNHLGDADIVVILSQINTRQVDSLGASNLHEIRWLGILADLYGVIWLHRGRPDRRAMACALESLQRGRFVSIAPEGRESLVGGLEQGLNGAAFLALRADVPVIPIAMTGTENKIIYDKRLRGKKRPPVTMTVGRPFRLARSGDRHADLKNGTDQIMRELARLLPPEYQGIYRETIDD